MSRASEWTRRSALLALGGSALLGPVALAAGPRVVVVVSDELEAYRIPADAFLTELRSQPRVYNLHGRAAEADALVAQLRANPPEIAFCVGAKAAYAIKNGLPETKVVFAAVLDPRRYGIVGEQVTGVTTGIEPVTYLSQFSGFFPDVRTVGVIRGPDTTGQRLLAMEAAAVELDKKLTVQEVRSPREVRRAFLALAREGIDALWVPFDRTVLPTSTYRVLVEEVRGRHLPLLVETRSMVEAGGLFTMTPDPEGMGQQAARLVKRLLMGEEPPRPEEPEKLLVVLNTRTLEGAELAFDPLLLDFVDVVIS